jgi:hypothetical protein
VSETFFFSDRECLKLFFLGQGTSSHLTASYVEPINYMAVKYSTYDVSFGRKQSSGC